MDHSPTIRAEIAAEVRLQLLLNRTTKPAAVKVGYLAGSHQGYWIYKDGDTIEGLPIIVDRDKAQSVTVVFNS